MIVCLRLTIQKLLFFHFTAIRTPMKGMCGRGSSMQCFNVPILIKIKIVLVESCLKLYNLVAE